MRLSLKTLIAAALLGASAAAVQAADVAYIHAGALLDRPGSAPRGNSTIVVRDGRIAEVRDGFAAPEAGAELVDLKDRFVLPGLIDAHVHLWDIGDPMRNRLTRVNRDDVDNMLIAVGNARATLEAGFTTVRDLGGDARGIRALREAVERGHVAGPTIVNAGEGVAVTTGSGDRRTGLAEAYADAHAHEHHVCDGADDCRRAVRREVGLGAQVIKFKATGGVLSDVAGGIGRAMTPEELQSVVETAHGLGRKVAAHSHAVEGTKAALRAGADTIEHGTFLDDEAVALFKSRGAYLAPTIIAGVTVIAQARAGLLPAAVLPKAEETGKAAMASYRKASAAGVRFIFGTDAGVSPHGENAKEFALLVEAGLTPAQSIQAATSTAAEALGLQAEIGSIEPGKRADVIAVAGDPLQDVRRLERVDFVMRGGVVHKLGGERQVFPPR